MNNKISQYLNTFREIKSNSDLKVSLIRIHIVFLLVCTILIIIESLFYLQSENRLLAITYFGSIYLILLIYSGLKYFFNYNNLFNNNSYESIAKLIGQKSSSIKDRLINIYQLENKLNKKNEIEYELSVHAINQLKYELSDLAISFNINKIKFLLSRLYFILGISFILIILFNNYTFPAINRLLNPNKTFEISVPFKLINITEDDLVFNGNDKKISVAGFGSIPDSITLNYIIDNRIKSVKINHEDEIFNHTFKNVQSDIVWWGNVYSNSFFSSWDNIESDIDTLVVIKRPVISNLSFEIIPPLYTTLSKYTHPSNMSNIDFPSGSTIIINGESNKEIIKAGMVINEDTLFFDVYGNDFKGEQIFSESSKSSIICIDKIFNQSSDPILYNFNAKQDLFPTLSIIQPEDEFELNESNQIDIKAQVSDDYGISKVWIEYIIIKPSYIESSDTNQYSYYINEFNKDSKIQNINYKWDISNINLSPEDEIHFTINIADNKSFSPNVVKSKKIIGRYPTLEDLFNEMEEYEQNIEDYSEELVLSIDDVQEMVNEIKLDLLKSDELGWDEKQELDKAIEEMENIFNQVEEIQEVIQKIQDESEKNNLISDELIKKYDDFQELLTEIMTPELLDAMESIQELSQSNDLDELLDQLNNFADSLTHFEEQIDRFIDMFQQAIAEQKIDEIIKKIESMLNQEIDILNELSKEDINLNNLSSDQRKIEEEYNNLQNDLNHAMELSSESSAKTAKMFNDLIESELNKETKKNIKDARESLSESEKEKSNKEIEEAKKNLSNMLEKSQEIQKNFQEETVNEMINEFLSVVNSILNISKYQDELSLLSNGIRSSSPILPIIAKKQDKIRLQNQQLMRQILLLSRKTFYITPPIIRALGKSNLAMDKSISYLEQKQSSKALKEQLSIIDGLNETAYLLLNAMEEMLSSGSASGFENFMEQLEQLSDQQQGINEGTMQLPQLGMNGQQSMMQQLMNQQQQLKEGLEQLLNNMPASGNSGGLGEALNDMEDVINDFKRNKVDRITKEKQQKILSRMLDSQKSLTKKDFSNNRKGEVYVDNILYDSPSGLPNDKGQRELLLINAMESALQEGHSNEYQELIKLYFYNLQKEEGNQ